MKKLNLGENSTLWYKVSKDEYNRYSSNDKSYHKETTREQASETIEYDKSTYYREVTDNNERNFLVQYGIYKLLGKISKIATFFLVLTILSIVAALVVLLFRIF